jgi:hypothetical protein
MAVGIANIGGYALTLTNCVVNGNSTGATTSSSGFSAGNGWWHISVTASITLTNTTFRNQLSPGGGPRFFFSGATGGIGEGASITSLP